VGLEKGGGKPCPAFLASKTLEPSFLCAEGRRPRGTRLRLPWTGSYSGDNRGKDEKIRGNRPRGESRWDATFTKKGKGSKVSLQKEGSPLRNNVNSTVLKRRSRALLREKT